MPFDFLARAWGTLPHGLAVLCLLGTACVAKGRYELSEVQLEATRAALSASEASCRAEATSAATESADCERERVELLKQLEAARDLVHQSELEIEQLSKREAEHVMKDIAACPPVDPETGERPDDTPEVIERRAHIDASVEDIQKALAVAARGERAEMAVAEHQERVVSVFQPLVDKELAVIYRDGDTSVVRLLVAKLFNENRTTLSPLGVSILERVAPMLREFPGDQLVIVGHTDDQPVHTVTHASNWELGFGYAVSVLRELEYLGIPMHPTAASAAGTLPIEDNAEAAGRRLNRRIELRFSPDRDLLERALTPPEDEVPEPPAPKE